MSTPPEILRLHDSVTGNYYELCIGRAGVGFEARWVVKDGTGSVVDGASKGVVSGDDPHTVFRQARRTIEDHDLNVIGNDWDFGQPPPSWMDD